MFSGAAGTFLSRVLPALFLCLAFHHVSLAQLAEVNSERLRQEETEGGNWMSYGRTYSEQRYSPLKQINDENVAELGLAWSYEWDTFRGIESTPLVVDGVMYNISAWNITVALDAKTGRELWKYDPEVPGEWGRYACCGPVSRGLAVWEGKVIIATLDGRLIALDASNGEPLWVTQTFDKDWPYSITGAPRVFDGKVLIGNSGADFGVRGFVSAYDADTGEHLWRFYTVPGNPAEGFENQAMAMAAETWSGEWWTLGGGGTVWDSIVYDPELKLVYIGTGNGSPLAHQIRSPEGGDNLFLCSVVALNIESGDYVWHYQEVPEEQWDYTCTQPMILADIQYQGEARKVLLHAPKNGFFYVLDRSNGELLSAQKYVMNNWASHVDMASGRPLINPDAYLSEHSFLVTPGPAGAHNWNPMAYSPDTGLVYFPVTEMWMPMEINKNFVPQKFRSNSGWGFTPGPERSRQQRLAAEREGGFFLAWDPVKQQEVWRVRHSGDGSGGALVTAGNLVVYGTIEKNLAIHRADTGEKLWEMGVQSVPMAGAVTYTVDGEQYIATNAGWGGGRAIVTRGVSEQLTIAPARVLAFKLGADGSLPAMAKAEPIPLPPPLRGSEEQVQLGSSLFNETCSRCHGIQAVGGLKDLRHMTAQTHADFHQIVLGGALTEKGMASFADILDEEQVEAIHHYLIARANEDWGEPELAAEAEELESSQ